ncbi:MAG: hypothetical protein GWP08_14080, partial [Nitrospiraceae bacterium]|nr:hypothetical protein [Nitrospiraceae bacterium]
GRLFSIVNVIDLFVVVVVCLIVVVAYLRLSSARDVRSPYPLSSIIVWVDVELRLPPENVWMQSIVTPGLIQRDARSGDPIIEIVSCERDQDAGGLIVHARVRASRESGGRLVFDNARLIPGRKLRVETETCFIDGVVRAVRVPEKN